MTYKYDAFHFSERLKVYTRKVSENACVREHCVPANAMIGECSYKITPDIETTSFP